MTAPDTSAAAVERLAYGMEHHPLPLKRGSMFRDDAAAMLRALLKERDAALTDARDFERQSEIAYAERDAAREAAARLREALLGALTAHGFTKERVASVVGDNWVSHARAALARGGDGG